jgi:hypothetical protein
LGTARWREFQNPADADGALKLDWLLTNKLFQKAPYRDRHIGPTNSAFAASAFAALLYLEEIMGEKDPRSTRVPTLGSISFGRSKRDCTIRSISAFGAALDVAADEKLPDEFALTVVPDGHQRRCAVVWRKDKRVAVAFY